MRTFRNLAVALGLSLAISPALVACASDAQEDEETGDGSEAISATSSEVTAAQATNLDPKQGLE